MSDPLDWRADDFALVVSGSGPSHAGAFLLVDGLDAGVLSVEGVDRLTSHGVAAGDAFYRVVVSDPAQAVSELFVYDRSGVALYRRIDGVADVHGIAWTGNDFVVAHTARDQVVSLDPLGNVTRTWDANPAGGGDSWHLNGVQVRDGRVVASAFGRFAQPGEFTSESLRGRGIVFDVQSGRDLVTGLTCPHDPRFVDGAWLVCDSRDGTVLHVDEASGVRRHTADVGGWTRGVAVVGDRIYVGVSAQRHVEDDARAAMVVLDRRTWRVVESVALPCREVNSITPVPRSLMGALRRGYRTNAYRVHVLDSDEMFRAVGSIHPTGELTPMRPLVEADCAVSVEARVPEDVLPGEAFDVSVRVTNRGSRTLLTAPPHPVNLGFELTRADGSVIGALDDRRAALPDPLAPGDALEIPVRIFAPAKPGRYQLKFTLVQESIRWFDALSKDNAARIALTVREPKSALRVSA